MTKRGKAHDRKPNGQFLPGHSVKSPGRPPGPTLRRVVEAHVAEHGGPTIEEVLVRIYQALSTRALVDDSAAARILLDHLVERPLHVAEHGGLVIEVVTGVPQHDSPREIVNTALRSRTETQE